MSRFRTLASVIGYAGAAWGLYRATTWEWLLELLDDRTTRLLTRVQETYPPLWSRRMLMAYGAWTAVAWAGYGQPRPGRHPPDDLLDRFIPHPAVDEYHQLEVDAPAPITFAVAKDMDLQAAPMVKGIFWLRAVPAMLRGQPSRAPMSAGIILIRYMSLPTVKREAERRHEDQHRRSDDFPDRMR